MLSLRFLRSPQRIFYSLQRIKLNNASSDLLYKKENSHALELCCILMLNKQLDLMRITFYFKINYVCGVLFNN